MGLSTATSGWRKGIFPVCGEVVLRRESYALALEQLIRRDPHLRRVVTRLGPPPMWMRRPGFATLARIVLEQQVSLASARATFGRLRAQTGRFTPRNLLALPPHAWRTAGVTRQKAGYLLGLAEAIVQRRLELNALRHLDSASIGEALMAHKGIGSWTADVYVLMALRRADVFPEGDLALAVAWQRLCGIATRPAADELGVLARRWAPWRAVAARVLWHYYLSGLPPLGKTTSRDQQPVTGQLSEPSTHKSGSPTRRRAPPR